MRAMPKELERMAREVPAPHVDKLEQLRDAARRMRDKRLELDDLEERAAQTRADLLKMEHETLPALFAEAGVTTVGVERKGNMPPFEARLRPYYKAVIAASWEPERQARAFAVLRKLGEADMIKSVLEIPFGMGQADRVKKTEAALRKLRVEYSKTQAVPHGTLTAYVRRRYEDGEPMSDADLETLGATVGTVVKLTEQKEK